MRIKNIFRRKKYAKGGVIPKEVLDSIKHDKTCDECERLEECKEKGGVQEIVSLPDGRTHYLGGHKCLKNPYAMAEIAYRQCQKAYNRCFDSIGAYRGDFETWSEMDKEMKKFTDSFYAMMKALEELFGSDS